MFKAKETDDAVSPVIGVILLVAVTVALVALATVIVFDIGSDVSDTADATVQLDQVDEGVQATVVRNENVDTFTLSGPYNEEYNGAYSEDDEEYTYPEDAEMDSVGDSVIYPEILYEEDGDTEEADTDNPVAELNNGDTISVIASLEDSSEEVLTSTDYSA